MRLRLVVKLNCIVFAALLSSASADEEGSPPSDWEVRGFVSALHDLHQGTVIEALMSQRAVSILRRPNRLLDLYPRLSERPPPILAELLRHGTPNVRRAAAWALMSLGSNSQQHILDALRTHEDWRTQATTTRSIGKVFALAKEVVALLSPQLDDAKWQVRLATIKALAELLNPQSKEDFPFKRDVITSGRFQKIHVLPYEYITPLQGIETEDLVSSLAAKLDDPAWQVRAATAETLGSLGKLSKNLGDMLARLVSDNHPIVREKAAVALSFPAHTRKITYR